MDNFFSAIATFPAIAHEKILWPKYFSNGNKNGKNSDHGQNYFPGTSNTGATEKYLLILKQAQVCSCSYVRKTCSKSYTDSDIVQTEEQTTLSEKFTEGDFDLWTQAKGWTKMKIAVHDLKRGIF